jgi:hypothetical protein
MKTTVIKDIFSDPASLALYAMARETTKKPSPKNIEKISGALSDAIEEYLEDGNNDVLCGAIECARKAGDIETRSILEWSIENIATSSVISPTNSPATGGVHNVSLFAIPVMVFAPARVKLGQKLSEESLSRLEATLKTYGVAQQEDTVLILDHLYQMHEIKAMTYCDVYDLHVAVTTKALTDIEVTDSELHQSSIFVDEQNAHETLRYLVGAIVGRDDIDPFSLAENHASEIVREANLNEWKEEASTIVAAALEISVTDENVSVESIDPFYFAFKVSMTGFKYLAIDRWVSESIAENNLDPLTITAVIAPYGTDGKIESFRISLVSALDQKLISGHEYEYGNYEDQNQLFVSIVQLLGLEGITTVDMFTDILPRRDAAGKETPFLTMRSQESLKNEFDHYQGTRTLH